MKNLIVRLSISILMLLLVSLAGLPAAQAQAYDSDIVLFVDEGSLTLYVAYSQDVSLQGFQFGIIQNEELKEFSPSIRFAVFTARNGLLSSGTCLIYVYDPNFERRAECNPLNSFESKVGPGDRFWYDNQGNRLDIFTLLNGKTTSEMCPAQLTLCPLYISIEKPFTDVQAEIEPYNPPPRVVASVIPETNLTSQSGAINELAWSPDGQFLLTGHANGNLCLWDPNDPATTQFEICTDTEHIDGVTALAWNPNPTTLGDLEFASAGSDGYIRLWKIRVEQEPEQNTERSIVFEQITDTPWDHQRPVSDISWNPIKNLIVSAGGDRLSIWDTLTGQALPPFFVNEPNSVDWRGDGRNILVSNDQGVIVIDSDNPSQEYIQVDAYRAETPGIDADWDPNFEGLATLTKDGALRFYSYTPESPCSTSTVCTEVLLAQNLTNATQVKFAPVGTLIAVSVFGSVHVMETHDRYHLVDTYTVSNRTDVAFTAVAWRFDANMLAAGDTQGNLRIWKVTQYEAPERFRLVESWRASSGQQVYDLTWHSGAGGIAIVDANLQLSVYRRSGERIGRSVAHSAIPLAIDWNQSQPVIATGGCGPMLTIWRVNAIPQEIPPLEDSGSCVTDVAFNPDGTLLVTASESGLLRLIRWDRGVQETSRRLNGPIADLEWNSNGNQMASVGEDGTVNVFDMLGNRLEEAFNRQPIPIGPLTSLSWSPDDTQLATSSANGTIIIWTLTGADETGTAFQDGYILRGHEGEVLSVSWNSENNWLVSVGSDKRVIVWDAQTGQRLAQLILESTPTIVKWAPVGATFAVGDSNGFVTLYDFTG